MPEFIKRPLQYLPSEIKSEAEVVNQHRELKRLCRFTRFCIAQLMKWNADRLSRHLQRQIENQTEIINRQAHEINSLRAAVLNSDK